jgi:hypothetical protein
MKFFVTNELKPKNSRTRITNEEHKKHAQQHKSKSKLRMNKLKT